MKSAEPASETVYEKAARLLGWLIVCMTIVVLVTPGGFLYVEYQEWRLDQSRRQVIEEQWDALAQSSVLVGNRAASMNNRIVEFVDYTCHFCRQVADTVADFVADGDGPAVVVRQLPNPFNGVSRNAALASLCAAHMGRFSAMHQYLLTETAWMEAEDWSQVASGVGIADLSKFQACLRSSEAEARLARDSVFAASLMLQATPAFVARDGVVETGVTEVESMSKWVSHSR